MGPDGKSVGETAWRPLREFTEDTRRQLEADPTPFGQLIATHIGRQLDLVGSDGYSRWFQETGERFGFDPFVTLAAIAGSDVTKVALFSDTTRAHFGTTQEHVKALAAQGQLRYGRPFDHYTFLEDLYMHAEGGRHYTQTELLRRGHEMLKPVDAERAAFEAALGILGHDSFNAGFGQRKLKVLLAGKYNATPGDFAYPRSASPVGFLVQVMDRLEACEPETMLRYVTEGVMQRREPMTRAIQTGLIDNNAYLRETCEQIRQDAQSVLTPEQAQVFLGSPAMQDLLRGIEALPPLLALLGTPPCPADDGFYYLKGAAGPVRLDSLAVFQEHFLPAVAALRR